MCKISQIENTLHELIMPIPATPVRRVTNLEFVVFVTGVVCLGAVVLLGYAKWQ